MDSEVLKMKELIASGTIGDVKLVQANFSVQPEEKVDRLVDTALGQLINISGF